MSLACPHDPVTQLARCSPGRPGTARADAALQRRRARQMTAAQANH